MERVPHRDPERRRAYGREWMRRNADKAREAMRRWRQRHPEAHRAQVRALYAKDPKRFQARIDASPNRRAVRRATDQRRRMRLSLNGPSFTAQEWLALVARNENRCAYCGAEGPLHADHRIPLVRGGSGLIDNILPACASCNLRKHTMTEEEFRARRAAERDARSVQPGSRQQVEE